MARALLLERTMDPASEEFPDSRVYGTIARELQAAAACTRSGDVQGAATALQAACGALGRLPPDGRRTQLSVRARLETARLKWLGSGADTSLSLEEAFVAAAEAEAMSLGNDLETRAVIAATMAGIACDMGDPARIEQAAHVLTSTIDVLLRAGRYCRAASLSTEQAALAIRRGRDLEASELLTRARKILEASVSSAADDDASRVELARVRHLMARLALHANGPLDEGALSHAIEHAVAAERAYDELGLRRDLARVWETIARIEAKRGRMEHARAGFVAAMTLSDDVTDFLGVARSTEGLAQVLTTLGDPIQALSMIASSIGLNRVKVCRLGLHFDERALDELERTLETPTKAVAAQLTATKEALRDAMRAVGPLRTEAERTIGPRSETSPRPVGLRRVPMPVPLRIRLRHVTPTPALAIYIREQAAKLDGTGMLVLGCDVTITARKSDPPRNCVRLVVFLPGDEVVVTREAVAGSEDVYPAVDEAFDLARVDLERMHAQVGRARPLRVPS